MTMDSYLTPAQGEQLLKGINPKRVGNRDGMSHLEAYDVRAHLNRVFGFARWSSDVIDVTQLYEEEAMIGKNKDRPGYKVAYRATLRLTVCAPDGTVLATYTECATGDGVMPDFKRSDAHDFAVKTAESQALKRCAANLGDQFGLSLYRKGSVAPLVGRSYVGGFTSPFDTEQPDADVTAHIDEQLPPEEAAPSVDETSSEVNEVPAQANAPKFDPDAALAPALDALIERILGPIPKGKAPNVHYAALQAEAAKTKALTYAVRINHGEATEETLTVKALIDRRMLEAKGAKS